MNTRSTEGRARLNKVGWSLDQDEDQLTDTFPGQCDFRYGD